MRDPEHDTLTVDLEVDLQAAPEVVWRALTEPRELANWCPLEARSVPGPGGSLTFSWGPGMEGTQPILEWEPSSRLVLGSHVEGGADRVEFRISSRGAHTTLELIHGPLPGDAAGAAQADGLRRGWGYLLWNLAHYLRRHPGTTRDMVWARRRFAEPPAEVWARLVKSPEGLDLKGDPGGIMGAPAPYDFHLGQGERFHGRVHHVERPYILYGTVDEMNDGTLMVEFEDQDPGGPAVGIWISTWGAPPERVEQLQARLDRLLENLGTTPA